MTAGRSGRWGTAARHAYRQHVYRCRAGCNRAERRFCPEGARLRGASEQQPLGAAA